MQTLLKIAPVAVAVNVPLSALAGVVGPVPDDVTDALARLGVGLVTWFITQGLPWLVRRGLQAWRDRNTAVPLALHSTILAPQ